MGASGWLLLWVSSSCLLGSARAQDESRTWLLTGGAGWLYGVGVVAGPFYGVGVGVTFPNGIVAGAGGGVGLVAGIGAASGLVWGAGRGNVNGFGLPVPMDPPQPPSPQELKRLAVNAATRVRDARLRLADEARKLKSSKLHAISARKSARK